MSQNSFSILLLAAALTGLPLIGSRPLMPPALAEPAPLTGSWMLQSFGDAADPTPVLPATPVTATFADGAVSGSAGCNAYRSTYQTQRRRLVIGPAATTRKFCAAAIMEQESTFLAALQTTRKYRIDEQGQLQIRYLTADGIQVLTFTPPVATVPLAGTTWKVAEWADRPSGPIVATLTANFSDSGKISGSGGCNNFSGAYQTTGNTLTIGILISTLRACIIDVSQQESAYFAALQTVSRYEINDQGQLQIFYTADAETKSITFDRL